MSDPTTMSPAGFEPALPKETDLKSVALDHSAKGTLICCIVGVVTVLYLLSYIAEAMTGLEPVYRA